MIVLNPGKCGNCHSQLVRVNPTQQDENGAYLDAMDLTLSPGFGERLDGLDQIRFWLCKPCGDNFEALFPKLFVRLRMGLESGVQPDTEIDPPVP